MSDTAKQQLAAATAVVPDAGKALKQQFWALLIVAATAAASGVGAAIAAAAPDFAHSILLLLPGGVGPYVAPLILPSLLGIAGYLQKLATKNTKTAIVDAVAATPPDKLKALYQ